jgi:hypothetical protein
MWFVGFWCGALTAITVGFSACASSAGSESPGRSRAPSGAAPFEVNSLRANYPLVGRVTGWYRVDSDSVVVTVTSGELRSRVPRGAGADGTLMDVWVAAGLDVPYRDGWAIDTLGAQAVVAAELLAGGVARVADLRLIVPVRPGSDLADRWLFFQLGATHRGLFGRPPGEKFANYACTPDNLLGPTAASRARAGRMLDDYVNAC